MRNLLLCCLRPARRFCAVTLLCGLSLLGAGCTSLHQFRTDYRAGDTTAHGAECRTNSIEVTPDYLLSFVEFDDQGWLWDRNQMNAVLDRFSTEDSTNGLLMLVFVHGWKHNADWDDDNVAMFRTNLTELAEMERQLSQAGGWKARKIAGVYVGWRGLSTKLPLFRQLTFWDRKNTAHEVGRGGVTELYSRLEDLRANSRVLHDAEPRRKPTQLIIVGHSFGGALTYSALAPLLVERAVQSSATNQSVGTMRGFGDLVVLINPAFEAARIEVLYSAATNQHWYPTNQPVNLAIFTSKGDTATGFWFPLGRRSSTLWEKHRDAEQARANITAVGHYKPFTTHDLVYVPDHPAAKTNRAKTKTVRAKTYTGHLTVNESIAQVKDLHQQIQRHRQTTKQEMPDRSYQFSNSRLVPRGDLPLHFPVYNVSVDKAIIPDHGTIDTQAFLTFLREFVSAFTAPDVIPKR